MKKTASYILITVLLVLLLSGCGTDNKEPSSASNSEEIGSGNPVNGQEGSGDWEGTFNDATIVLDNSLDAYSATLNGPLRVEEPADSFGGGEEKFLGATRAWYFKKHLYDLENVDKCWDELSFVTVDGKVGSQGFDRKNQMWRVGPVAGTDHYFVYDYEMQGSEGDGRFFFTERDEQHRAVREIPLDFLEGVSFSDAVTSLYHCALDRFGTAHLVWHTGEGWQYQLVSQEGETLAECALENEYVEALVPLYDGRIAFLATDSSGADMGLKITLQYMDKEEGRPVLLAASETEYYYFTLFDEKTLLYADSVGVYRSGLSGKDPELIYKWINHGISVSRISAMHADEEGRISLIYDDSDGANYLCLEPTTEEVEIRRITLAVSPMSEYAYKSLAVEFNKRYPRYHIELKSGYDETALLTELTAGKGPVLIDTFLTGFEGQEKLWEPLDAVLEQLGITDELQPSTLELGKIDGTLYGIVTNFSLRTLVTGDPELKDWDYGAFLQCIEDRPGLEAIYNFYGGDYRSNFVLAFLSHGVDDAYFLNEESGEAHFDSDKFRRVLALADRYCVRKEGISPGASLLEGKVLCNELTIRRPEQLAMYRACYGEDANYIGYPTQDGAAHFIESGGSPMALRRTATEEEKEVAKAFIGLCLSYEGQSQAAKDLNFGLSVRRDVLEEQIASMNEDTEANASGFGTFKLGDDLNIELDRKVLLEMIDGAEPLRYLPKELRNIMFDEMEPYFSGTITEDMLIDHLENRVGLYLGERN